MAKNIEMNIKSESGYEVLYPKTTSEMAGSLSISGGTLSGPLILNREPQESMEAVSKGYVDNINTVLNGSLSQKLSLSGGIMSGIIDMGNNIISNLGSPINNNDAVNKNYVDGFSKMQVTVASGMYGADNTMTYQGELELIIMMISDSSGRNNAWGMGMGRQGCTCYTIFPSNTNILQSAGTATVNTDTKIVTFTMRNGLGNGIAMTGALFYSA